MGFFNFGKKKKEKNTDVVDDFKIIIGKKQDYSHDKDQIYNNSENEEAPTWGEIKDQEEAICQYFIDRMENKDLSLFSIEHRAEEYTSLVYKNNDFFRVKYTPNSKWISIRVSESDREHYENDELFSIQKNKNQSHWKARIVDMDCLEQFVPLVDHACVELVDLGKTELDPISQNIYNTLKKMLIECGADGKYIKYSYSKAQIRVQYISWQHEICFKVFKKKPNQLLLKEELIKKNEGCFSEKKNGYWIYEFRDVEELDVLKPFLEQLVIEAHDDDLKSWFIEHWED